jgi:hypothetical protein
MPCSPLSCGRSGLLAAAVLHVTYVPADQAAAFSAVAAVACWLLLCRSDVFMAGGIV